MFWSPIISTLDSDDQVLLTLSQVFISCYGQLCVCSDAMIMNWNQMLLALLISASIITCTATNGRKCCQVHMQMCLESYGNLQLLVHFFSFCSSVSLQAIVLIPHLLFTTAAVCAHIYGLCLLQRGTQIILPHILQAEKSITLHSSEFCCFHCMWPRGGRMDFPCRNLQIEKHHREQFKRKHASPFVIAASKEVRFEPPHPCPHDKNPDKGVGLLCSWGV